MDETIKFEALLDRVAEADFVISVLPSTPETKGLLTEEHFKAMKDNAVFMNFGRGDLVAESILIAALKSNEIRHAVLDVFEMNRYLLKMNYGHLRIVRYHHMFQVFPGSMLKEPSLFLKKIWSKWLQGERDLVNLIDLELGY